MTGLLLRLFAAVERWVDRRITARITARPLRYQADSPCCACCPLACTDRHRTPCPTCHQETR